MPNLDPTERVTRPLTDLARRALTTPAGMLVEGVNAGAYRALMRSARSTPACFKRNDSPEAAEAFMGDALSRARLMTQQMEGGR